MWAYRGDVTSDSGGGGPGGGGVEVQAIPPAVELGKVREVVAAVPAIPPVFCQKALPALKNKLSAASWEGQGSSESMDSMDSHSLVDTSIIGVVLSLC